MKSTVLGALVLSSLLAAGTARAQNLADTINSTTFGNPGQVAISGDFDISFTHENDTSTLVLAPAIDYFAIPQLSFGGQVLFSYEKHDPRSDTAFGLAPRVGFNIPLAPMFSFWPKAGFGFVHASTSTPAGSGSANFLSLFLYAPFLFHPVPHFFIGFGPSLSGNVAGGDSSQHFLTFSLSSVVGGYFDW